MDKKLGRGLDALLSSNISNNNEVNNASSDQKTMNNDSAAISDTDAIMVDINRLIPNENQPRKDFDYDKIVELSNSIKNYGIIQPIIVKKYGSNYSVIAGERRLRAAKIAGLEKVPVRIIDCKDSNVLSIALVENIQRTDLNPIEEAEAFKEIMQLGDYTQEQVAKITGKSRVYVANSIRLLNLPDSIMKYVKDGQLSAGHARALIGINCAEELAEAAIEDQWSVRQIEDAVKEIKKASENNVSCDMSVSEQDDLIQQEKDSDILDIENRISSALKSRTKIKFTKNGGVITINVKNYEQMNSIVEKLINIG